MKISNILFGTILTTIGAIVGYIDYFIVSIFYDVSSWVTSILNAPESFALFITFVLVITFIGIILIIAILAAFLFLLGFSMIFDN